MNSRLRDWALRHWVWIVILLLATVGTVLRYEVASRKELVGTDESSYLSVGRNFWSGRGLTNLNGHPSVVQPPLHGVVVAGVGTLFGIDDLQRANALVFAVFGGVCTCLLALLALCVFHCRTTALWAAGVFAFLPTLAVQLFFWDSTAESTTMLFLLLGCLGFA